MLSDGAGANRARELITEPVERWLGGNVGGDALLGEDVGEDALVHEVLEGGLGRLGHRLIILGDNDAHGGEIGCVSPACSSLPSDCSTA